VRSVIRKVKENHNTKVDPRGNGVQVRVSNSDQGFRDDVVKNIIATLWNFEDLLSILHPSHRYYEISTMHDVSDLSGYALNAVERLELLIDNQTSRNGAIDLVNPELAWSPTYDFRSLKTPYYEHSDRAIDFLQHEETLDEERLENWIKVCVGLVRYVRDADPVLLWDLILKHCEGDDYSVEMLMGELGLVEEWEYYQGRLLELPGHDDEDDESTSKEYADSYS